MMLSNILFSSISNEISYKHIPWAQRNNEAAGDTLIVTLLLLKFYDPFRNFKFLFFMELM